MVPVLRAVVLLTFLVGCDDAEEVREDTEAVTQGSVESADDAVEEPVEESPVSDGVHEAEGLRVRIREDGTVQVTGQDRWGTDFDTVYANAQFYRDAVEVLKRSFEPAQHPALDSALAELPEPEAEAEAEGAEEGAE